MEGRSRFGFGPHGNGMAPPCGGETLVRLCPLGPVNAVGNLAASTSAYSRANPFFRDRKPPAANHKPLNRTPLRGGIYRFCAKCRDGKTRPGWRRRNNRRCGRGGKRKKREQVEACSQKTSGACPQSDDTNVVLYIRPPGWRSGRVPALPYPPPGSPFLSVEKERTL